MPVCMVLRNVKCPASGVGEYHLPLGSSKLITCLTDLLPLYAGRQAGKNLNLNYK